MQQLRPAGVAFLLTVEAVTVLVAAVVLAFGSADHVALARLGVLVALWVVYTEIADRVERIWVWLHTDRGAWVGQGSILLFTGVLLLPTWAALAQALLAFAHFGIRNRRYATEPAHRWVWSATTVVLGTLASSYAFHALGGNPGRTGAIDLLIIGLAALIYSGVNLLVLLAGMYLAMRPPTFRELVPARGEFSYEAAKLLLGVVAATLLIHAVLLTPAVLVFGALLQRSTLVSELRTAVSTDDKTGLLTHRAWSEQAASSLSRCQDAGRSAAVLLLDLDHFKQLNDTHGHAAGDRTLTAIGAVLADEVRPHDLVGRYGGEEFVVFLPDTAEEQAVEIAQRLRERIANASAGPDVTASLGVAALGPDLTSLDELLLGADAAMYRAKHHGRNTVCTASA